ncbi:MAG: NAD(+)/NADH kinase [Planctomycetota bacterium]|nr:NAD(+)/NADH kinase [Planctomycetota bacterium]
MNRLVIFANPDKPEAMRLAAEAERETDRLGLEVCLSTRIGEDISGFAPDLAAVFGGDGTVLGAASALGENPPPILAFNLGRLGYLAENSPDSFSGLIRRALAGELRQSVRMRVEAGLESPRRQWRRTALNEFALVSRLNGRLLPLSVWVDGKQLMDIRGDGIIIGTPTGSTGYALAAGGPVVSPELAAIILAPICPHQLANRSLVLDPTETVRLQHFSDQPIDLLADGRLCLAMDMDETLTTKISPSPIRFLSSSTEKYKLLREKLGWGWKATHGYSERRMRNG